MLYKDCLIECPKNTKLSSRQNKIRYIYHMTGKVYNKKNKHADDKGRICISRMVDDMHFIPNDNYFDIYDNKEGFELVDNPRHSDTLKMGAMMLVRKMMDDLGLSEILTGVHGEDEFTLISDLISYMIIGGSSSSQHFPDFMFGHYGSSVNIRQYTFIS